MLWFVLVLILLAATAEIVMRVKGYSGWEMPEMAIVSSDPENCMLPDTTWGYRYAEGTCTFTSGNGFSFSATHNADGFRQLYNQKFPAPDSPEVKIALAGCSFTYGQGVKDEETFAWKWARTWPNAYISNYSLPGYGTVQALQTLRHLIRAGQKPDYFVLVHGSFHQERNTFSAAFQQKLISAGDKASQYEFLKFEPLGEEYEIQHVKHEPVKYPLREYSGFMEFMEERKVQSLANPEKEQKAQQMLFDRIFRMCESRNIQFVLLSLDECPEAHQFWVLHHMPFGELNFDFSNPEMTLMPLDPHPSAKGHDFLLNRILEIWNAEIKTDSTAF